MAGQTITFEVIGNVVSKCQYLKNGIISTSLTAHSFKLRWLALLLTLEFCWDIMLFFLKIYHLKVYAHHFFFFQNSNGEKAGRHNPSNGKINTNGSVGNLKKKTYVLWPLSGGLSPCRGGDKSVLG